jgi:hypothetical protein
MGCGASAQRPPQAADPAARPPQDADPPVLLEMEKKAGQSSGLFLVVGPLGYLRVHDLTPESPFFGLIEPGDELMEVNGVEVKEAERAAELILAATDLTIKGRFNKPPPPKPKPRSEESYKPQDTNPPSKPTPSNPTQAAAEAYMAAFNAKDAAAAQATFAVSVSLGNNKGIGAPKSMPTEKIIGALKGVMFESFGFTFVDPAVTINGTQAVIDTKLKVDTTLPAWETASGKPAPFPPVPVKEMVSVTGELGRTF